MRYFLLDSGEVYYSSKGIDESSVTKRNDSLYVEAYVMTSKNTLTSRECEIIASANTLREIEKYEEEFLLKNSESINAFYKNLTGKRHSYKPSDMKKHLQNFKKINRLRIMLCIRNEEDEQYNKGEK